MLYVKGACFVFLNKIGCCIMFFCVLLCFFVFFCVLHTTTRWLLGAWETEFLQRKRKLSMRKRKAHL